MQHFEEAVKQIRIQREMNPAEKTTFRSTDDFNMPIVVESRYLRSNSATLAAS